MSKTLVIGASGYLGGRLVREPFSDEVLGTFFMNQKQELEYLDLRERTAINSFMDRRKPDLVLLPAGVTSVDECEKDPELAFKVNAEAASVISDRAGVKVVYYSTDYVFDGNSGEYREDSESAPINVYGRSKLQGEKAVLRNGSGNLVLRVSGLYGPSGADADRFNSGLNKQGRVPAEDDRISSPVFLDDVISATRLLLKEGASGIFHVAGPHALSRYEFQQMFSYFGDARWQPVPVTSMMIQYGAPRPRNTSLSTGRLDAFGWTARTAAVGLHQSFTFSKDRSTPDREAGELLLRVDEANPEVILLDCIGGLLTQRTWLQPDPLIDAFDQLCGANKHDDELRRNIEGFDASASSLHVQKRVVQRYAPNPLIWSCLRKWKGRHKLVLANDGMSATFRMWINRYGLDLIFDDLINSSEVGMRKSQPEFYRFFAKRMGVDLTNCLLIDDDQSNIDAARRSGAAVLRTHALNRFPLSEHGVLLA